MKQLLIGILFTTMGFSAQAMSFSNVKIIYMKLVLHNFPGGAPMLSLDKSRDPNADEGEGVIHVTAGMLTFARNNDEMALVLGHELGHFAHHDTEGSHPSIEYLADAAGARFEDATGYNHCVGAQVIYRFHDKADATHPASDERYRRLTKGCKL